MFYIFGYKLTWSLFLESELEIFLLLDFVVPYFDSASRLTMADMEPKQNVKSQKPAVKNRKQRTSGGFQSMGKFFYSFSFDSP